LTSGYADRARGTVNDADPPRSAMTLPTPSSGYSPTERTIGGRHEVHLIEFTMLEEHHYSAILGYLHAAIRTEPDLERALDVHKHIERTLPAELEAAYERILRAMDSPALVAFTVYFWNRPQSIELARRIARRWPDCAIVFGGNDVTHQQQPLFDEAPFTRVLVHGEGELRFRDVCRVLLLAQGSLAEIDGISYRDHLGELVSTPEAARITDLETVPSPLLSDVYTDDQLHRTRLIIYETNRGCPYSCNFCFWGGATKSKVRQFSMDRIRAELTRIVGAAREGASLFIADANFGILGRDLEIAQFFVQLCLQHGKRLTLMTNWAKNSNSKVVEIATVLHQHGMAGAITLSAQSFDERTLQIANRSNIKHDRYRTLQLEFRARQIPTYTDLIWGLPGESLATHLAGVEQVLQAGGCPVVYPLLLLNNTEYASDTFGRTHRLQTRHMPCDISDPTLAATVVVGHDELSYEQWRRGMQYIAGVALFAKSAMRCTLRYLSACTGIRIVDMVDVLMTHIDGPGFAACPELTAVQANHREALDHPERLDETLIDGILGQQKTVLEDLHYQAMMYLVLDDAQRQRAVLREASALIVESFGLDGVPGLGDLPGVHSVDMVGGTMWRAGSAPRPLTGMFAVSGRALGLLVEHGDVPAWDFDPAAPVISGRSTARPDRVGYWNTAYAMSLLRGARRLLFDAETRLVFGAGRGTAAAPASGERLVSRERLVG